MKTKTKCLTCHKPVEVELVRYGKGYIATCPECGKLAMNKDGER